ncbi:hypothetical protein PA7_29590 [Pseudonocardia asaccharolytica DSM 44247 = NBRC 16224]|uniref:Uncharacterized protein n=1 Tax=Pseudonocardia asaccharolytica DSM 44247 = NBRC 16224 TaxID=1123024 RepID=A0A511D2W1_9PSEU|nr:hypothetical protein PA7_29590 [Pseudonocardia asaccharolytica DSM 44247 = NBRC 16224]
MESRENAGVARSLLRAYRDAALAVGVCVLAAAGAAAVLLPGRPLDERSLPWPFANENDQPAGHRWPAGGRAGARGGLGAGHRRRLMAGRRGPARCGDYAGRRGWPTETDSDWGERDLSGPRRHDTDAPAGGGGGE